MTGSLIECFEKIEAIKSKLSKIDAEYAKVKNNAEYDALDEQEKTLCLELRYLGIQLANIADIGFRGNNNVWLKYLDIYYPVLGEIQ